MLRRSLLAAAALVAAAAHAAPRPAASLTVTDPWSRPAVSGTTGAGFMVITNHGKAADALVRVESSAARKVEIHRSTMAGGVMSMQAQARVDLPAGASATFAPGGYHLMFVGLSRTLKPGDTLPATLSFASGKQMNVGFSVRMGATPAPVGRMDDHMGH